MMNSLNLLELLRNEIKKEIKDEILAELIPQIERLLHEKEESNKTSFTQNDMNHNYIPDILTVKEVANLVGWHTNTVYQRCAAGELKSFKSGNSRRIKKSSFLEWIAKLENS